jgi:hypothetical protein
VPCEILTGVGTRRWLRGLWVPFALACTACGSSDPSTQASSAAVGCEQGAALQGGTYDIAKSRFAFGSTPTHTSAAAAARWEGVDGAIVINANGAELGVMTAGAPETNLPDFSSDSATLQNHTSDYFGSMGVQFCQISNADLLSGSSGNAVVLERSIAALPIVESNASARFNSADQTTNESFYWPAIPADVIAAAEALSTNTADSAGLAKYKALLPAEAQGPGRVVIHHTSAFSTTTFRSAATYDVQETGGSLGAGPTVSFDAQGMPVASDW